MKLFSRFPQRTSLLLVAFLALLVVGVVTCGKKSGPLPPISVVPQSPADNRIRQSGDFFLYFFLLPTLNTDNTPTEISKIEIYKLTDPRVIAEEPTQTAPTQTQPQTQSAPTQTQTQDFIQSQTQTQTQSQTAQTQTSPSQTQTQTQKKQEDARTIEDKEFKSRSELVAEIPADQVQDYVRDNYFGYAEKLDLQPESEQFKNWSYYGAKIYNKKGKTAGFTKLVALFPAPVPRPPANFTATIDEQGIHLIWKTADTDILGKPIPEGSATYNIYRGTNANFAPIEPLNPEPVEETTYTDTTTQNGQAYYYFVRAHNKDHKKQQESAPSNVILIYSQDTFPPTPPEELNVVSAREGMVLIDPVDYHVLLPPIMEGKADVVFGSRFVGYPRRVLYFWHSLGNQFLTLLANMLNDLNLSDMETCYKVFTREVRDAVTIQSNRFGFEPEFTAKVAKKKYSIYEVPISYAGRGYKEGKKITWRDGAAALYWIFRYRFFN